MEDELSVAAGPVGEERLDVWSAGGLRAADTRHEPGPHRRSCLRGGSYHWPRASSPTPGPPFHPRRVSGASDPLGRCTLLYMDDCLVHPPTLALYLLHAAEGLEIFRRQQPPSVRVQATGARIARPPTLCGRRAGGPAPGAAHRRVGNADIVEWATPRRGSPFHGARHYYRRFVEGYASCWRWSTPCGRSDTTCLAARCLSRRGAERIPTCGQTTWRSPGSRRSGILTRCTSAGSMRSSAST